MIQSSVTKKGNSWIVKRGDVMDAFPSFARAMADIALSNTPDYLADGKNLEAMMDDFSSNYSVKGLHHSVEISMSKGFVSRTLYGLIVNDGDAVVRNIQLYASYGDFQVLGSGATYHEALKDFLESYCDKIEQQ